MELFTTVISGVLVFVLGQLLLKLVIEPLQELKKEIALTLDSIVFYENISSNPGFNSKEEIDKVSSVLRKHASNLKAKLSIIPFYTFWYMLRILPSKENIEIVSSNLIGLSNSLSNSKENSGIANGTIVAILNHY